MLNKLGIAKTPLICLDTIWCKCEYTNHTGSIKDRIAYEMLKGIRKHQKVIEVSSGNTAISVAMVCAFKGIDCTLVVPESTSPKKVNMMRNYGATVILIDGNIQQCLNFVEEWKQDYPNDIFLNQFKNQANVEAQRKMALEIQDHWRPLGKFEPQAVVTGIGTSGTLAGLFKVFPNARFYTWECDTPIEGTSDGVSLPLKPKECHLTIVNIDKLQVELTRKYLQQKGFDVGPSSAANFLVSDMIRKKFNFSTVTILVDRGDRYS